MVKRKGRSRPRHESAADNVPGMTSLSPVGWWLIAHGTLMVLYLVIASTSGAGYERELEAASKREGVGVNAIASSSMAEAVHSFPVYHLLSDLYLLLPPVVVLLGATAVSTYGGSLGRLSLRSAQAGLIVWWTFMILNLGFYADPDALPPVVRNMNVLSVPLLTVMSVLIAASVALAGEAVRSAGVARIAGRVASIVGVVLTGLFAVTLFASNFEEPIPPILAVIPAIVLGIALARGGRVDPLTPKDDKGKAQC